MQNGKRTPQRGRRKKAPRIGLIILLTVLTITVLSSIFCIGYIIHSAYKTPDTEPHSLYTGETGNSDDPINIDPGNLKRKKNCFNFLLLGLDKVSGSTDVVMLFNFDTESGRATLLQIPRDTYIKVDGTGGKINTVFARLRNRAVKNGASDPVKTALEQYKAALQNSLNIKIDYYAMIDLSGFRNIVDHIGGVTVTLPYDLDYEDPDQDLYIHLNAGTQKLNGTQAEGFVRFRYAYALADIGRVDAQKIFMSAFIRQFRENLTAATAPAVITDLFQYVTTSLELSECIYFAKQSFGIDMSNIRMMTLDGDGYRGGVYYIMCRETALNVMNTYFNVFETPIPDRLFDIDLIFAESENSEMLNYYRSPGKTVDEITKTAEDINNNGIYIPLDPNKVEKK